MLIVDEVDLSCTDISVQYPFDDGAEFLGPRCASLTSPRARLLSEQILSAYLAEGWRKHRNVIPNP